METLPAGKGANECEGGAGYRYGRKGVEVAYRSSGQTRQPPCTKETPSQPEGGRRSRG